MRHAWIIAVVLAADGGAAHYQWQVPRALESVPVSGPITALGVPLKLHAVRSQASAEELFQHFLSSFQKAGFYVPPRQGQFQIPGGVQLTGLDIHTHVSYTVIFQPNPDRTTTVILGEADLDKQVKPRADAAGVPLYPGAHDVLQTKSEGSATVTYAVDAPGPEVSGFYRQTFQRAGYQEQDGAFVRGDEEVRVLAQGDPKTGPLFVTVMTRQRRGGSEPRGADAGP